MKTHALFFPFDLFGHPGARRGAELLADAVQEMLRDNRRERKATRARAYTSKIHVDEILFDSLADYVDWRTDARAAILDVLGRGEFLLWTAGNHLGVLPLYDALANDPAKTLIIQFDAHLDLYDLSDTATELSHGNFLRHVDGPMPTLVNLGHRELVLRDDTIGERYTAHFSAESLAREPDSARAFLTEACAMADRIVFDIDCDVFDAAYFPAVAQPEPFGLSPAQLLRWLADLWSPKVKAVALSEFDPARDIHDRSLATLLWLVEWIFLKNHEKRQAHFR